MKYYVSIAVLSLLLAFGVLANAQGTLQTATIAGKIRNYDPEISFRLTIHRLGLPSISINPSVDGEGNFHAELETYIPTEVVVSYKTNFRVLVYPQDSLFVSFDGGTDQRVLLLSTILYGGSDAVTNTHLAQFQLLYFGNELYDWKKKSEAFKNYSPIEFMRYNDTIRAQGRELYQHFVARHSPNEKSRRWALFESESDYFNNIQFYASDHMAANNLNFLDTTFVIPDGFYDKLAERLPLDDEDLTNTSSLRTYSDFFLPYVYEKLKVSESAETNWTITPSGGIMGQVDAVDSVRLDGIIRFVTDPLLREILMTNLFSKKFVAQDVSAYEKFSDLVSGHITLSFLKDPLRKTYLETKLRIENPEIHTEAVLKEMLSSSFSEVFDDILATNKNKVIYIDVWATWCGPCLAEFPNSRLIERELNDKDVAFVYLCIDSDYKKYKSTLTQYQLQGQHYFLSSAQGSVLKTAFEIGGIPFYILIDKNGVIQESGSHLRPLTVKSKIEKLLE